MTNPSNIIGTFSWFSVILWREILWTSWSVIFPLKNIFFYQIPNKYYLVFSVA